MGGNVLSCFVCVCVCVKINEAMNIKCLVREKGTKLSDYYDLADWLSKGAGGCVCAEPEQVGQLGALAWKFSRAREYTVLPSASSTVPGTWKALKKCLLNQRMS